MYANLPKPGTNANASGIKVKVYYCPKSDILTFPKVSAIPLTLDETVKISEDFVMVTGKKFFELHSTQGKGKVEFESIGEAPHQVITNKGTFSFPDINDAAKAFAKAALNDDIVYVVQLLHQTETCYVLLGNEDYETETKIKGTSGDKPGSAKGLDFTVTATDYTPLPTYAGALLIAGFSIDCATGIKTVAV